MQILLAIGSSPLKVAQSSYNCSMIKKKISIWPCVVLNLVNIKKNKNNRTWKADFQAKMALSN